MDSNTTTTIATSRGESLHYHHHNTTRASIEKERNEWKRIKVTKNEEKRERKEIWSVERQACTNRSIPSLPLKAYPLMRIKNLFGHTPLRPVPTKWIISTAGLSCEVIHVEEVVPFLTLAP